VKNRHSELSEVINIKKSNPLYLKELPSNNAETKVKIHKKISYILKNNIMLTLDINIMYMRKDITKKYIFGTFLLVIINNKIKIIERHIIKNTRNFFKFSTDFLYNKIPSDNNSYCSSLILLYLYGNTHVSYVFKIS